MSSKNYMAYSDAETILSEFANDIKDNTAALSKNKTISLYNEDLDHGIGWYHIAELKEISTGSPKAMTILMLFSTSQNNADWRSQAFSLIISTKKVSYQTNDKVVFKMLQSEINGNVIWDQLRYKDGYIDMHKSVSNSVQYPIDITFVYTGDVGDLKTKNLDFVSALSGGNVINLTSGSSFIENVSSPTADHLPKLNASGKLVDSGKALSDLATAESVTAILDGTTIDSFGDVETALADKLNLSIIASTFSSSKSYLVDDYVLYEDELYKCINAHMGDFSISDFSKVTAGQELTKRFYTENVAPAFSNLVSYNIGDYVTYGSKLYRCSVAHQGDQNSTHFSEYNVKLLVNDLVQKLTTAQKTALKNLLK